MGAPVSDRAARELRIKAISDGNLFAARQGVWAKDGDSFVNIQEVDDVGNLSGLTIYKFGSDLQLETVVTASSAVYRNERWRLTEVTELSFSAERVLQNNLPEQQWRSSLSPDKLGVVTIKPEMLSLTGLAQYVDYLEQNDQEASRYELAYWRKVLQPLSVAAMLLLALSFIFGPLRSVTMAARVLLGILTGFGFFMSNELFGPLALVYQLPPLAGAMLPSLLFMALAVYLMRKKV
ncbi:LPS export ABC transporter permease LptG [Arsukibacterium sp.]|uniref:LPS export ABC transporter permease LptG n=1 Tax=Arsukibacterium sp. TaxID=1977258 RepID=UPI00341258F6